VTRARIDYDGRRFRSLSNSESGEVDAETRFEYHQEGDVVWATYRGGAVTFGTLVATADAEGNLDMRYQHVNTLGAIKTGICRSTPELLPDGRLRLHESWQWTCGEGERGRSVVEEEQG
jgi:hypothetical protein